MSELPLLHIGQTATRVTALDASVAVMALVALGLAVGLIWRRELGLLARRRLARTVAIRVATLTVLFAVLPAALPYDHLFFDKAVSTHAEEAAHSMHCHLTPGSCSDAPIAAGPGQFIFGEPLIVVAPMLLFALVFATRMLAGRTLQPDLRPPIR